MGGPAPANYGSGGGVGNVGVGTTVGVAVGSVGVGVATGSVGVETGSVGSDVGVVELVGDGDPPDLLGEALGEAPGPDPPFRPLEAAAWSRAASFVTSGESGARVSGLSAR